MNTYIVTIEWLTQAQVSVQAPSASEAESLALAAEIPEGRAVKGSFEVRDDLTIEEN